MHRLRSATFRRVVSSVAVLLSSFSVQATEPSGPEALQRHVAVSFREAPVRLVYQAVLAGTGYDAVLQVDVDEPVSGDYTGSIKTVLNQINTELSLNIDFDDSIAHVRKAPLQATIPQPDVGSVPVPQRSVTPSPVALAQPLVTPQPSLIKKPVTSRSDQLVERLFVLQHANAADKQLADEAQTVIPGVVSQVRQIVSGSAESVIALPSMNALVIRDRASNMAQYEAFIRSIDKAFVGSPEAQLLNQSTLRNRVWRSVQ